MPKMLALCAPMPNRNMETEFLEEKKENFISLPGKGENTAG